MHQCRVDFDSISWETPAAGVRFKAHRQGSRQLRLVEFTKGFAEADWCRRGHIGYVLAGRCEINFSGRVIEYGPGDGIFIPAGGEHKHMARVLTDAVKLVLVEDI